MTLMVDAQLLFGEAGVAESDCLIIHLLEFAIQIHARKNPFESGDLLGSWSRKFSLKANIDT